jgi:hypothetical protein
MRRVTAPGGVVAACTWHRERLEMTTGFWEEAIARDPGAEAVKERQRHLSQPGELAALWRGAGLAEVEETSLEVEMEYASFDDYWRPIHAGTGPLGAYLLGLPPARQDALREAVRARFQPDGRDRAFTLRATALAVRGVVPAA